MIDFSEIMENIKDIFSRNKKPILISGILVLFFIVAVSIACVQSIKSSKKKPLQARIEEPLEADQELLLPDGPSVPSGYAIRRTKKQKWTEEEVQEWFSLPSSTTINSLEKSNDNVITEITGNAP